mmetsp:Transcript_136525/g.236934  ORF Transcript_136525/g.236934 Transcript_136525/m.236934 type:complete len:209 (-) Transcript_136525:951-1577(-)
MSSFMVAISSWNDNSSRFRLRNPSIRPHMLSLRSLMSTFFALFAPFTFVLPHSVGLSTRLTSSPSPRSRSGAGSPCEITEPVLGRPVVGMGSGARSCRLKFKESSASAPSSASEWLLGASSDASIGGSGSGRKSSPNASRPMSGLPPGSGETGGGGSPGSEEGPIGDDGGHASLCLLRAARFFRFHSGPCRVKGWNKESSSKCLSSGR